MENKNEILKNIATRNISRMVEGCDGVQLLKKLLHQTKNINGNDRLLNQYMIEALLVEIYKK
jgi:hypothetical protein